MTLAAIISQIQEICVKIVDNKQCLFWNNDENIIDTLRSIGMSTRYDFGAIGGFTYQKYSDYYKK